MEWNGVERSEWSELEWAEVECGGRESEWDGWNGVEWSGVEWSGVEWSGVEWSGEGGVTWPTPVRFCLTSTMASLSRCRCFSLVLDFLPLISLICL
jgi:hypothetical protein